MNDITFRLPRALNDTELWYELIVRWITVSDLNLVSDDLGQKQHSTPDWHTKRDLLNHRQKKWILLIHFREDKVHHYFKKMGVISLQKLPEISIDWIFLSRKQDKSYVWERYHIIVLLSNLTGVSAVLLPRRLLKNGF